MATKAEIREQITAAGLPQPPESATKADLLAVLDAHQAHPSAVSAHPAPQARPKVWGRASAIRSED